MLLVKVQQLRQLAYILTTIDSQGIAIESTKRYPGVITSLFIDAL